MQIRTIQFGDYFELAELLHSHFFEDKIESWMRRFVTWWDHNPYFKETDVRGWGIFENEKLVGFLGNIPFPVQIKGEVTVAVASTSWFVKEDFRGGGNSLALLGEQIRASQETVLFNTSASVEVATILERLRFTKLDAYALGRQSFYIHQACQILRARLSKFHLAAFAYPLSILIRLLQLFRVKTFQSGQCNIKEITLCGPEFDELWENSRINFATTVVRDACALNWYCFSSLELRKRILALYKGGELFAFVILGFRRSDGYITCECLDLWGGSESDQLALLSAAIDLAQNSGGAVIQFNHFNQHVGNLLKKLNLFERMIPPLSRYFLAGKTFNSQLELNHSYFGLNLGDHGL